MARITFVHGIKNKPPPDALLAEWTVALAPPLGDHVDVSGVYWADLIHDAPLARAHALAVPTALDATGTWLDGLAPLTGEDRALDPAWVDALPEADRAWVHALERALGLDEPVVVEKSLLGAASVFGSFLRLVAHDAYLYLYDKPALRAPEGLRTAVRKRFVDVLRGGSRPHVVVGHSLGSVIAYDCLKNVEDCPPIDALISIGSPLGLRPIQSRLIPGFDTHDAFPTERLEGPWLNFYDAEDIVCRLDPILRDDFRHQGAARIEDREVHNPNDAHGAIHYLRQPAIGQALAALLG